MRLRTTLLAPALLLAAALPASAGFQVQGFQTQGSSLAYYTFYIDLYTTSQTYIPPVQNFDDPTHPTFTSDVDKEAIFNFGMQGIDGETFVFGGFATQTQTDQTLVTFDAQGSEGDLFHITLNALYYDSRLDHTVGVYQVSPAPPPDSPPYPPGAIAIDFRLTVDPPFTVGIFALDPVGGNVAPVIFTQTPEPSSLALMLGGLVALAGYSSWTRQRLIRK